MTMSLLLQTTQGMRGALSALPSAQASQGLPGTPEGFQSVLRQAFDTRTGSSAENLDTPSSDSLDAFRDALAALGADVEALDDAELGALFSATERALSNERLSQGARVDIFAQLLNDTVASTDIPSTGLKDQVLQNTTESANRASNEIVDEDTQLSLNSFFELSGVRTVEAFRNALTALGADIETLDDAELGALFSATEQALSSKGLTQEARDDIFAQVLSAADVTVPAQDSDAAPVQNAQRQVSAGTLDEVQARLALVAAFTDTPKMASPAASLTETATTSATPALSDAAARVLSAVNALQAGNEASAKPWTGSTVDARPTWSAQPLTSLYNAAAPLDTAALDADTAPLPTSASASAMQGALASASPTGVEQVLTGAPPAPTAASPVAGATPVTNPAFAEKLGQQLIQLTQRGGEQQVKLELHPAELGPLTITLKMGEQHTQAQFFSAHAQVRQIVEQAIPQLREALAEQGIALGETSVGEHGQPKEQGFAQANGAGAQGGGGAADDMGEGVEIGVSTPVRLTLDGRVDLYA
ncbi:MULTISPECIES: flagellar hook-length control protein FliK [unclassified Halomonas]|uniref:flagellar hook-length control protein FliK n=1 Tax=unclassified Halomonas TaxID=2609666 RepID=UPI002076991A|nr:MULTISPECIES: flagellar hook-length control protein FliK [unclassified Halomonas]